MEDVGTGGVLIVDTIVYCTNDVDYDDDSLRDYRDGPLVSPLRAASLCGLRREYFRKRLPAIL